MIKGYHKGIKPIVLKRLALLMGICYLLNPMHNEINLLLHEISHIFKMPNYVMSHDANSGYHQESYAHTDYQSSKRTHDHQLVDFIDAIFEVIYDTDGTDVPITKEQKIDKHITVDSFVIENQFTSTAKKQFWPHQKKALNGYFKSQKEPPRTLRS